MKTYRRVYIVNSTMQNEIMIFGTEKRAKEWINNYNKEIFDRSKKEDLYITKRIIW